MKLLFTWKKLSNYVATFRVEFGDQSFTFEGTDLIDSLSEMAEATALSILDNQAAEVAFENEPGQHLLNMRPLCDGRVELTLSWVENPYTLFGEQSDKNILFKGKVTNTELLTAVVALLHQAKEECGNSKFTLEDFKFPETAFKRLQNA